MAIKVRKAKESDFPRIFEIEKRSYPPRLQTRHDILRYRHRLFGIWVVERDGLVAGFNSCVPIRMNWPNPDLEEMWRNRKPHYLPWFQAYERALERGEKFNCLLNSSSAVETAYQGMGVGTALVKNSLLVAKKHGLKYRVSALRCQFGKYFKETGQDIDRYIEEVTAGTVTDRFLALYRKLGFVFAAALPDYEPDQGSLNYCIFTYKKID